MEPLTTCCMSKIPLLFDESVTLSLCSRLSLSFLSKVGFAKNESVKPRFLFTCVELLLTMLQRGGVRRMSQRSHECSAVVNVVGVCVIIWRKKTQVHSALIYFQIGRCLCQGKHVVRQH